VFYFVPHYIMTAIFCQVHKGTRGGKLCLL